MASPAEKKLAEALEKVDGTISKLLLELVEARKLASKVPADERTDELSKLLGKLVTTIPRIIRDSPIVLDVYISTLKTASVPDSDRWKC